MKVFFNNEAYEMPSNFKGKILDRIITENTNAQWVPLLVDNKEGCVVIMLGYKVSSDV